MAAAAAAAAATDATKLSAWLLFEEAEDEFWSTKWLDGWFVALVPAAEEPSW